MSELSSRRLTTALYVNAGLLAVIALILLMRTGSGPDFLSAALAQRQPAIAGGGGVFIVPGQFSATAFGCYLLDIDSQTIAAYQYFPGERELRLSAVRTYQWDRRLNSYNTSRPSPLEVKDLIEKQDDAGRLNVPVPTDSTKP